MDPNINAVVDELTVGLTAIPVANNIEPQIINIPPYISRNRASR